MAVPEMTVLMKPLPFERWRNIVSYEPSRPGYFGPVRRK